MAAPSLNDGLWDDMPEENEFANLGLSAKRGLERLSEAPNPRAALEAIRSGSKRSGSLRTSGGSELQKAIDRRVAKFYQMVQSGTNRQKLLAPAYVNFLATEYSDIVCNPLAKQVSMPFQIDDKGVSFDAFGLDRVRSLAIKCNKPFIVVPLQGTIGGDLTTVDDEKAFDATDLFEIFVLIQLNQSGVENSIEYFSPQADYEGFDRIGFQVSKALNATLKTQIRATPPRLFPKISANSQFTYFKGLLWTLYYFQLRVTNPDMSADAIIKDVQENFNSERLESSNQDFLDFLEAFWTYFKNVKSIKERDVLYTNDADQKLLTDQNVGLLARLNKLNPLQFLISFLSIVASFDLCYCMAPETQDDPACIVINDVVDHPDSTYIRIRKRIKSHPCSDSRLIFITYKYNDADKTLYSFVVYDKIFNILFTFPMGVNVSQTGKYGVGTIPKNVLSEVGKEMVKVLDLKTKTYIATDVESVTPPLSTNSFSEAEDVSNKKYVWSGTFAKILKDRNLESASKSVLLGATYFIDYLFLYYNRITQPHMASMLIVNRRKIPSFNEFQMRLQFNLMMLKQLANTNSRQRLFTRNKSTLVDDTIPTSYELPTQVKGGPVGKTSSKTTTSEASEASSSGSSLIDLSP